MKVMNDVYIKGQRNAIKEIKKKYEASSAKTVVMADSFSQKSLDDYDKNTLERYLEEKRAALEALNKKEEFEAEMAASKSEIEGVINTFDVLLKCLKIATRIISGDKVPPQDEKLLLENFPDIYSASKTLAKQKEEGKKHKSLADKIEDPSESAPSETDTKLRESLNESISQIETALADFNTTNSR